MGGIRQVPFTVEGDDVPLAGGHTVTPSRGVADDVEHTLPDGEASVRVNFQHALVHIPAQEQIHHRYQHGNAQQHGDEEHQSADFSSFSGAYCYPQPPAGGYTYGEQKEHGTGAAVQGEPQGGGARQNGGQHKTPRAARPDGQPDEGPAAEEEESTGVIFIDEEGDTAGQRAGQAHLRASADDLW